MGDYQHFWKQGPDCPHLSVYEPLTLENFQSFVSAITAAHSAYQDYANQVSHQILILQPESSDNVRLEVICYALFFKCKKIATKPLATVRFTSN